MGSLGGVTSGLGTSFDTTLLGLIYSIILSFPLSAVQKTEDDNLNSIDAYCNETLLPRLNDGGLKGGGGGSAADVGDVLDRLAARLSKVQTQFLTDLTSTSKLVREQVESLDQRAAAQSEMVQTAFIESMQKIQKSTTETLATNVTAVTSHIAALEEALTSLNNVLKAVGERQVQVEVRPRGFFSRLFGRR